MPVRIYEIARKFGIENKVVLAKAKELGIIQAKTASSTIDKISAEYLEQELAAIYERKSAVSPASPSQTPSETGVEVAPSVPAQTVDVTEPETGGVPSPVAASEPVSPAAGPAAEQTVETPSPPETPEPKLAGEPDSGLGLASGAEAAVLEPSTAGAGSCGAEEQLAAVEAGAATGDEQSSQPLAQVQEKAVVDTPVTPAPPVTPTAAPPEKGSTDQGTKSESRVEAGAVVEQKVEPPKPRIGEKVGFIQLPTVRKGPAEKQQQKPQPKPGPPPQQRQQQSAPAVKPGPKPSPQPPLSRTVTGAAAAQRGPTPAPSVLKPSTRPGLPQPAPAPTTPRAGSGLPRGLPQIVPPPNAPVITMKPPIVVRDLAYKLNQKPFKIIADLMEWGIFSSANQALEEAVARQICAKYGYRFELEKRAKGEGHPRPVVKKVELDEEDRIQDLKPRPPVVTVMGHVDHGKTTLLDAIRKSNVAAKEVGGITQHIGAYTISVPHPDKKNQLAQITFIDTPGHAAFSAMRARGANVTDIVVLVVAANEGVMPQTLEALNHARAANVPIIVAVNKCDHPNANPLLVRTQLQEHGLVPDDWGGDTIFVDISALTKQGIDKLLEMILLQAEMMELRANPNRPAKGNVIESGIEPGGPVATVLVRKGTLRVGDFVLCDVFYGKVRALINDQGQRVKEAGPSMAVKMLGLNGVPEPGHEFVVVKDEETARKMAEERAEKKKAEAAVRPKPKVTLEELLATIEASKTKTLKLVLRADTQGSVEAIVGALRQIQSDKVKLEIVHAGVGAITESDVLLASASQAVIVGFQTKVDATASKLAKQEGVQIKLYRIIYELIDEVRKAMAGLLEPVTREVVLGTAEVKQIFQLSKGPPVAGCVVTSGRVVRGRVRVLRRDNVIFDGVIQSMRHYQDEVSEVKAGQECGIRVEGFADFQPGDVIQSYTIEKVEQGL